MLCRIVIAGRPNAGKSTLFNRLTGTKRAITDAEAGVTRDLIWQECFFGSQKVLLCDSGGIQSGGGRMDRIVSDRSLSAIKDADIILLMLDARNFTAEDEELLEKFRVYADKIILVVNKIDDVSHDVLLWNFYSYGYPRVAGISAAHGRGIGELEDYVISELETRKLFSDGTSDDETEEEDKSCKNIINISIMGKPNTGKSTLANHFMKREISIVSDIAGTTRDTVQGEFSYKNFKFVITDTAGMRRKGKVDEDVEYYSVNRAVKSIDSADVVLLMIDALEGISEQDKKIASLITRRGCAVILVLNKTDLFTVPNQLQAVSDRLRFLFPILGFAPLVGISAKDGKNTDALLDCVIKVYKESGQRISTSALNAALKTWNENYSPPRSGSEYYKVLYATQVDVHPVRFLFFVNRKKGFPDTYISYIKNKIRDTFALPDIPIEVNLRERERFEAEFRPKRTAAAKGKEEKKEKRISPKGAESIKKGSSYKASKKKPHVGNVSYRAKHAH